MIREKQIETSVYPFFYIEEIIGKQESSVVRSNINGLSVFQARRASCEKYYNMYNQGDIIGNIEILHQNNQIIMTVPALSNKEKIDVSKIIKHIIQDYHIQNKRENYDDCEYEFFIKYKTKLNYFYKTKLIIYYCYNFEQRDMTYLGSNFSEPEKITEND